MWTHAGICELDAAHVVARARICELDAAHIVACASIYDLDAAHVVARARVAHQLMLCRALDAWVVWEK